MRSSVGPSQNRGPAPSSQVAASTHRHHGRRTGTNPIVTPAAVTASSLGRRRHGKASAPPSSSSSSTDQHFRTITTNTMTVDKQIVDELLLVCGVIGTTTTIPSNDGDHHHHHNVTTTIVPVTDCVQWLQDLQRCLRRDDDVTRPISRLLHSWNIVVQKLLPLVVHTQYDSTLIITISKILVLLTKPLHVQTIRAGRMMIPASSSHTEPAE